MLDVCLLGTGGMMPLPRRFLTAAMLRYNGSSLFERTAGTVLRRILWASSWV